MFARSAFGNQFQPFAFGASPFTAGAGFGGVTPFASQTGGYNPLLPILAQQLNPISAFGGYNPVLPQIGNYGINPYQAAQLIGISPVQAAQFLQGLTPTINPLVAAQLATVNPAILSGLAQQSWGGGIGQQFNPGLTNPPFQQNLGQINPLLQQFGGESSNFGQTPFSSQFGFGQNPFSSQFGFGQNPFTSQFGLGNLGQGLTPFHGSINPLQSLTGGLHTQVPGYGQFSPFLAQDPITATLLAQQLNPLAQQKLPIRPLTGQQQVDPFQASLSGIAGSPINPMVDPYSALAQAQLMAQCAVNPLQQMGRAYPLSGWTGSPHSMGQTSLTGQVGVPFNG